MSESANHAELEKQVKALENESRELLSALKWSVRVRNVLLVAMTAFAVGFGFLYYSFFEDLKNNRLAEVQELFLDRQDEFIEPLTKAAYGIAENAGPDVFEAFRQQMSEDTPRYLKVVNEEGTVISETMSAWLSQRITEEHSRFVETHEAELAEQFPELNDPEKRAMFEKNLQASFEKIGQRYYVDFFQTEYSQLLNTVEQFPLSEPRDPSTPVAEQLVLETSKLFQMLAANTRMTTGDSIPATNTALNEVQFDISSVENEKPAPQDLPKPTLNRAQNDSEEATDVSASEKAEDGQ